MQESSVEAIRGISREQIVNACGTVGGLLLAGAQLPQIYHVTIRRRTHDVSYTYQYIFASGLIMFLLYYGFYHLWDLFIPTCLSLACVCYLIGLKTYLEVLKPKHIRRTAGLNDHILRDDDLGEGGSGLNRALLGGSGGQQQDEFIAYSAPVS